MKFLVIPIQKYPMPAEAMVPLVEATIQWMAWAKGSGKFDVIYSIAGQPGGLGIVNVNSLEELNEIVQQYPMTPLSDVQVYPLSDVDQALTTTLEMVKKMASMRG